jgi:hypothetical protein
MSVLDTQACLIHRIWIGAIAKLHIVIVCSLDKGFDCREGKHGTQLSGFCSTPMADGVIGTDFADEFTHISSRKTNYGIVRKRNRCINTIGTRKRKIY